MRTSNLWVGALWVFMCLSMGRAFGKCDVTPQFLRALAEVESGNRDVPGDNGNAQGPFQIWKINVREANRILRCYAFSYDLRHDYEASAEMTRVVLTHWEKHFERKYKMELDVADLAAIHRWGPSWTPKKTASTPLDRERGRRIKEYLATNGLES